MKKFFIIFLLILAGCSSPKWGAELSGIEKVDLLTLHNSARTNPLQMHLECDIAAQAHAEWMASNQRMSHSQSSGPNKNVSDRLKKQWTYVGENIAYGQNSPTEVTNDWLNSTGHRRNIKSSSFKYVGFGIAESKDGARYWCAVFSD